MKAATLELRSTPGTDALEFKIHPDLKLNDDTGFGGPRRRAVVYPLKPTTQALPLASKASFSVLLVGGLNNLGLYKAIIDSKFANKACFSISSASFLLFLDKEADITSSLNHLNHFLQHWECWTIQEGKLVNTESSANTFPHTEAHVQRDPTKSLPYQVEWLVAETISNLKRLQRKVETFFPPALPEIALLRLEFEKQLRRIESAIETISIASVSTEANSEETLYKQQLAFDRSHEYIIQLNAAIVYANSQFAHGFPPAIETLAMIRPFSLLGTGTAWKAIFLLYQQIFSILRADGHAMRLRRKLWPDDPRSDIHPEPLKPRVIYFSGRNGFSEDDTSISFASQTIPLCATPERTLLTVTHEVLHSHVKHLLAAAFTRRNMDGSLLSFEESLLDSYADYLNRVAGRKFEDIRPTDFTNPGEYLCLRLVHECISLDEALWEANGIEIDEAGKVTDKLINARVPNDLTNYLDIINQNLQLFEELIVHSLDFRYFYQSNAEVCCNTVWITWSALPRVIPRIEMYTLRVLVAIATSLQGDNYERLDQAKKHVLETAQILEKHSDTKLIGSKLKRIVDDSDKEKKLWLDIVFPKAIRFVDCLLQHFTSTDLEEAFRKISETSSGEQDEFDYLEGDIPIAGSKIAAVREMLRLSLMREGQRKKSLSEITRKSALFLIMLSTPTDLIKS